MITDKYVFTREQLSNLLLGTLSMFQEYRDAHDKSEGEAVFHAINEMFEGLDAERELLEYGDIPCLSLQKAA